MNKFYSILLASISIYFLASCGKNESRQATVIQTGDITFEGCGYLLEMDDDKELVKPVHLPAAYQHPHMKVSVIYNHTGVVDTCDYGPKIYDLVNITEIQQVK